MNGRNQTCQAFVTCSGPFRDSSCQFVYSPKNVRSTKWVQKKAFQDNIREQTFDNSSTVCSSSSLKCMHALIFGFSWIRYRFPCAGTSFLNGFFQLLVIRINKKDASQLSLIVEVRFLDSPLLLFFSLGCFWHSGPHFWPQMIRSCGCLNFCKLPPGLRQQVFHSFLWAAWNRSMVPISFDRHRCSNHNLFNFLATHPRSHAFSWSGFRLHWVSEHGFLTRLNSPAPPCLRPKYLLSKFLPHTIHIQGIVRVKLSYQIGGVLTRSLAEKGWYSTMEPNGIIGPSNGSPNRLSKGVFQSDKEGSWLFLR